MSGHGEITAQQQMQLNATIGLRHTSKRKM